MCEMTARILTPMYTIRPATRDDQAAIRALIRVVGINPLGIKWQRFLVAVDEADALIGCGQIKPHRDGSRELASIAVEEAWRSRGIGRTMIGELQEKHGPPLWLTCRSELTPFYEPSGFTEITDPDRMPPYFRRVKRFVRLLQKLTWRKVPLAVMLWDAASPSPRGPWKHL